MSAGRLKLLWLYDDGRPVAAGRHVAGEVWGFGYFGAGEVLLAFADESGKPFAIPAAEITDPITFFNLLSAETEADLQNKVGDRASRWLLHLVGRALSATAGHRRISPQFIGFDELGRRIAGPTLKVALE
jgi:hypothetical protein